MKSPRPTRPVSASKKLRAVGVPKEEIVILDLLADYDLKHPPKPGKLSLVDQYAVKTSQPLLSRAAAFFRLAAKLGEKRLGKMDPTALRFHAAAHALSRVGSQISRRPEAG